MVIDYILDRKDGYGYDVKEFYDVCMAYEEFDIARALDGGTEKDVKKALCDYVIDNDYPKSICKYINSENWLEGFEESKKSARKSITESKSSIRFEDLLNLNANNDLFMIYYANGKKYYASYYRDEIFENHQDLLSLYIERWAVNSDECIVSLKF